MNAENAMVLAEYLEEWIDDPPTCQHMIGRVVAGHVVSLCASVRITPGIHEAGVETHPCFVEKAMLPRLSQLAAAVERRSKSGVQHILG